MAESPASNSSGDSDLEASSLHGTNHGSKVPAVKDKECQYCHQHFTSSSLGRHLDQFISKKKPDGIHNVDEIRRLRGGITRRTARGSKKDGHNKDYDDGRSARASPATALLHSSGPLIASTEELNRVPPGGLHVRLNRLNWQATGVITDPTSLDSPILPAPPTPGLISSPSTTNGALQVQSQLPQQPSQQHHLQQGTKRSYSTFASDAATNPDNARALELALREVLDSLRAATKHTAPLSSPFKFDIQSQSYPALCLKILPAPATLFQASPFSTQSSIPISPPGPDQVQPLRQKLTSIIDHWKWHALRLAQPTSPNIAEEADFLSRSAAQWTDTALSHLDAAYQNWMSHPLELRTLLWNIEILRAFQTEKTRVTEMEEKLETLQQEADQLHQQVEHLSRCQWPREMALWPPERRTWSKDVKDEIRLMTLSSNGSSANGGVNGGGGGGGGANGGGVGLDGNIDDLVQIPDPRAGDKWDFDHLVNKWKGHVKEDRLRRMPVATMGGFRTPTLPSSGTATNDGLKGSESRKSNSDGGAPMGIYGNGNGNGMGMAVNGVSPTGGDEKRRSVRTQKGNISIVSDY